MSGEDTGVGGWRMEGRQVSTLSPFHDTDSTAWRESMAYSRQEHESNIEKSIRFSLRKHNILCTRYPLEPRLNLLLRILQRPLTPRLL
jgi:hypothetical protein